MVTGLAIAAAAAIAACLGLALIARRPGDLGGSAADLTGSPPELPVALVSLAVASCSPGAEAYEATIVDLAARGFLGASLGPDGLRIRAADPQVRRAGEAGLTSYERQVLDDATTRLGNSGDAPIDVVADACRVDVRGTWEPFESAVRADARQRGLTRPLLPVTGLTAALGLAAAAGIGTMTYLIFRLQAAHGAGGASVLTLLIFLAILRVLTRRDTLTSHGSALADRWRQDLATPGAAACVARAGSAWPGLDGAGLHQAAFATAARAGRVPHPTHPAGLRARRATRARSSPPQVSQRPARAWSYYSGTWRPVEIRAPAGPGVGGGIALVIAAGWAGVIAYGVYVVGGGGPLTLIPACAAVGLGVAGLRALTRRAAIPTRATFDGQVVARWVEDTDSESGPPHIPYIAVDDGQYAWAFAGPEAFGNVALGDRVKVTANPRSGKLIGITVTSASRNSTG